jgi:plastocyanin
MNQGASGEKANRGKTNSLLSLISSVQRARIIPVSLSMVVLGATVALKLGVGLSQAAVSPTMHAVVHPNNDIGLTFDDGSPVGSQDRVPPTIPAGTYVIRVIDDADEHNFHLVGPGVDMATSTGDTGTPTWTVTFQAGGVYRFVCDTHVDFMFGAFQASSASSSSGSSSSGSSSGGSSSGGSSSGGSSSSGSSSGTQSSSKSAGSQTAALRGTLAGTVASDGSLKLLFQGKAVSRLKSGRYKITVVDKTPARSFVVQQNKHSAITVSGVSFVGTHSVTVDFKVGQWTFYTSAGKKSKSSFVVVA